MIGVNALSGRLWRGLVGRSGRVVASRSCDDRPGLRRTPLNAIVGFVDLLREGVYGEPGPRQVKPVGRSTFSLWLPGENELAAPSEQAFELSENAALLDR